MSSLTWKLPEGGGRWYERPEKQTLKNEECICQIKEDLALKNLLRRKQLRLYKTLVVRVLLNGCETWKMNKGDDRAVDVFHNKCLRRILQI